MKKLLAAILTLCLCSGCQNIKTEKKEADINNCFLSADTYSYDINFNNIENCISGTAEIKITNNTNTAITELHIRNYAKAVSKSKITDFKVSDKKLKYAVNKNDKTVIVVALNKKLKPTNTITLSMNFSVQIPKKQDKLGYTV